jgi:hypothetical protein
MIGQRRKKVAPFRPFIEFLERRCVPTTLTPTTFDDGPLGSSSLRDAVLQFNADTGTDDDTILLEAGTYALTIQNTGGHHETAGLTGDLNLTQTSHRWIIQGAGPSTIIDAGLLQDRVFQIANAGTQVVFRDLVIQGGLAQDNGSDGALAGSTDALGGGILNNGGNVTLDHVVIQNNEARGSDGAARTVSGHNANGGGMYSTGGTLTMAGVTITNNRAMGGRGGDHNGTQRAGNGGSANGGGLYATGGSLDISDSMIAGNRATGGQGGAGYTEFTPSGGFTYTGYGNGGSATGGGLYVNGGSLTLASSAIATNQATGGNGGFGAYNGAGGGLYNAGTLTVLGSTRSGNSAFNGGGIANVGTLTVMGSTLSGNSASYSGVAFYGSGGGIWNYGTLTVSNSTLSSNSAIYGGGIYIFSGMVTVTGSTLSGNSSSYFGGGIYNLVGTLTVSNSTLSANSTQDSGGGIYIYSGMVTVTGSTLSGNSAVRFAGGIYIYSGMVTVSNSTLSSNSGIGSGIYNDRGTVTVTVSTLSGNTGRGIYNDRGTVTVTVSTLSGNSTSGSGAGIYNVGTLTVTNSTLSGNSATSDGGGIYNVGTLTVSNSTVSGNSAQYGGGIYNGGTLPVALTNVTLTANRANIGGVSGRGGGVYVFSGSPMLHNTLIAGNFNGTGATRDDVYGLPDPGGDYNLIGDGTGMTGLSHGVNGNLVGSASAPIDPLLGPLQDNGGPTLTHALLPGSPALNADNPAQLGVADQRGVVRSGGVNIGAYQASASAFVLTVPGAVGAGTPFDLTVKAVDPFGQTALGYGGTAQFTSSDPLTVPQDLPRNYTFTSADAGQHTFTNGVTLKTAGSQSVTATDTATASITGSAAVAVTPAAADHFMITVPASVSSGTPFDVTVTVVDAYGNTVPTYLGTVHLSTTDPDPGVILPADYMFQASDGGSHVFAAGVTLITPGDETLTVTDTSSGLSGIITLHL